MRSTKLNILCLSWLCSIAFSFDIQHASPESETEHYNVQRMGSSFSKREKSDQILSWISSYGEEKLKDQPTLLEKSLQNKQDRLLKELSDHNKNNNDEADSGSSFKVGDGFDVSKLFPLRVSVRPHQKIDFPFFKSRVFTKQPQTSFKDPGLGPRKRKQMCLFCKLIRCLHMKMPPYFKAEERVSSSPTRSHSISKRSVGKTRSSRHGTATFTAALSNDKNRVEKTDAVPYIDVCPTNCTCTYGSSKTVDVVDCSNRKLVEIPPLPPTASTVYLQNNKIKNIPCTSLTKMISLKELDLSQNKITEVFKCSFASLTSLQKLDLSKNLLTKIENNTFQGLRFLDTLFLKENLLLYVPETFGTLAFLTLTSLTHLHLEGNNPLMTENFTYPDQALTHVTSLQYLWLDGYPRELGPGFLNLRQLVYISFASRGGGFCKFGWDLPPKFFSSLATKKALTLDMSSCFISNLPPELFSYVPNIFSLDLSFNRDISIDGFEKGSQGLNNSNLTVLRLNEIAQEYIFSSKIKRTTFRYLKYTTLKVLSIESNNLVNIQAEAIYDLPMTVEYLSFFHNNILSGYFLVASLHLLHLKTMKVSFDNRQFSSIMKTPKGIDNVGFNLSTFIPQVTNHYSTKVLSNKNLKREEYCAQTASVPSPYPIPRNMEWLYISGYNFKTGVPKFELYGNTVLRRLECPNNGYYCFGGPFYGPKSLHYLDLSKNWAFQLNPYFFLGVTGIKTLLLSQNRFGDSLKSDVKGVTFSFLTNLETLDLSNNVIEVLSEQAFESNRHLKALNLSKNSIRKFTTSLAFNHKLGMLDLSFNPLEGLSKYACLQLRLIKEKNPNFEVNITGNNEFSCDCSYLYFLEFLLREPGLFHNVHLFSCSLAHGSKVTYAELPEFLPKLGFQCLIRSLFLGVLAAFFLLVGSLAVFGLYHYKRWQWKYLHHIGRSRLHIGSTLVTFKPVAKAFITYDQENAVMRRIMRNLIRPRLQEMGVSTVLGEIDFAGGPLAPSIAGAVASTGKTVVFLSPDIFQDSHRRLEFNLAVMHELELGRPVLVPVLVLLSRSQHLEHRRLSRNNQLVPVHSMLVGTNDPLNSRQDLRLTRDGRRNQTPERENLSQFFRLLRKFPPEISTFLEGQVHRCLVLTADRASFWQSLKLVILEE